MALSAFSKIDANTRIDRAQVNRAPVEAGPPATTVRDDLHVYHPLANPASLAPGWAPPAAPVKSIPDLRADLRQAITAASDATAASDRADHALRRAIEQRDRASADYESYADLDEDIASAVVDRLRDGDTIVDDRFDTAIVARDRCRVLRDATASAVHTLQAEADAARDAQVAAVRRVDSIAANILNRTIVEDLVEEHVRLTDAARVISEKLHGWNQWSAGKGVASMPPALRSILGVDIPTLARRRDTSFWIDAASKLREDPDASTED